MCIVDGDTIVKCSRTPTHGAGSKAQGATGFSTDTPPPYRSTEWYRRHPLSVVWWYAGMTLQNGCRISRPFQFQIPTSQSEILVTVSYS